MPSSALDLIRSANDQLKKFQEELVAVAKGDGRGAPSAEELQALGRLMEQVRSMLKASSGDAGVRAEILAYNDHLRQIRSLLEGLESQLSARRDYLRAEWSRLQAAAQWGKSLKQVR